MTPKITYRLQKNILKIRIAIHGSGSGMYDTGIFCNESKFDVDKQISGDTHVQTYMDSTTEAIKKLFVPGMDTQGLWSAFLDSQAKMLETHTVKDAFDYYTKTKKVAKSTLDNKDTLLDKLTEHGFDKKLIKDMNAMTQRNFFSLLDGLGDSTLHKMSVNLHTVLDYYIQEHALAITLPKNIFKKTHREADEGEYMIWEELKKLLRVVREDEEEQKYLDFICFMCLTGMAVNDALKFDPKKHLNMDSTMIRYKRQKTKSECLLPVFDPTRKLIEKIKWPFRCSIRTIQYKCDGFVSELIGRKFKSHGCRKTFGTVCLELGYSLEAVSKFMGHSTPVITAQIYARVTEAKIRRETQQIPQSVLNEMTNL